MSSMALLNNFGSNAEKSVVR